MLVLVALVGVLIDSARIDTLWMCEGKCGVAIGAAYRPLLSIHVVMWRCVGRCGGSEPLAGAVETGRKRVGLRSVGLWASGAACLWLGQWHITSVYTQLNRL
jgi:hypothetical protein